MPSAAKRLDEFASFCAELRVENGEPLELLPYQREALEPYFGGARELAILLPKKNGKSSIMAALALYHLIVTPNAECIIVAASREQAEIILGQTRVFIRNSTALGRLVKLLQRSVLSTRDEGRIRVLAADADTADGVIPTLAIVDELHRHRTAELYGIMRDGLGPRNGQVITISTAGATVSSPLGLLRVKAHALPSFSRDGKHNTAFSEDGSFAFHEWCLDAEDDVHDMTVVKEANPAPWHTVDALQQRHDSMSMEPYTWLRFACGIWTEGEKPWLDPKLWDDLGGEVDIPDGASVTVGVDVESRKSEAALVLVTDALEVKALIGPRSLAVLEDDIRELRERYDVDRLVYMDKAFERSADILEEEGLDVVMIPDSPKRKEQVAATLFKAIEEGRLRHDADAEFRAQVLAGRIKESESGWRFVRDENLPRPICALVALAAAVHVVEAQPRPSFMVAFT